jgi:hypothetical protein
MKDHTIKDQFKGLSAGVVALALSVALVGCGSGGTASGANDSTAEQEAIETTDAAVTKDTDAEDSIEVAEDDAITVLSADELEDGTYDIEVETDSSMFRAESCTLTVVDGVYTATLSLPGEGFSRLYFGSAEEAAEADDADIADYYLNDDAKYTFDLAVEKLDEELPIAAYGQRRDTWYDHTIIFHAPSEE